MKNFMQNMFSGRPQPAPQPAPQASSGAMIDEQLRVCQALFISAQPRFGGDRTKWPLELVSAERTLSRPELYDDESLLSRLSVHIAFLKTQQRPCADADPLPPRAREAAAAQQRVREEDAQRVRATAAVAKNEADVAAAQRLAAAERAARDAEARAAAAEQQSAAVQAAAVAAQQAAATAQSRASASVPADLAAWLSALQLSAHGPRLVAEHKLAFVADCRFLEEGELISSGLARVEAKRFLSAAAKLGVGGGDSKRLAGAVAAPASVGSRVRVRALVIGIDAYAHPVPGKLANAGADAKAVHAALAALPGAASTLLLDCSKAAFEAALIDFRDGTGVCKGRGMSVTAAAATQAAAVKEPPTLGVVFFAGHGLQVSGRNYLVPSDFKPPSKNDNLAVMLKDTARACVSLEAVEEVLEDAGVSAGAVLLDCCRNVPDFLAALGAKRSVGSGGTRALPAGMSEAAPRLADLMVTFATAPGTEALDRSSRLPSHSPFTAALLAVLAAPKRLVDLNPFLTDAVHADSGGKQRPHVGGSYGTEAGNMLLG
jgi:hypothetical protein